MDDSYFTAISTSQVIVSQAANEGKLAKWMKHPLEHPRPTAGWNLGPLAHKASMLTTGACQKMMSRKSENLSLLLSLVSNGEWSVPCLCGP